MTQRVIIIKYGEIGLKKRNRHVFEDLLIENIQKVLLPRKPKVFKTFGRLYVEDYEASEEGRIVDRLKDVFGIVELGLGMKVALDPGLKEARAAALELMGEIAGETVTTFKVETSRSNKGFKIKSPEVSRLIGGLIHNHFDAFEVEVHHPQEILHIEIREKIYLYVRRIPGVGGLPYGGGGTGLLLLSGGFDSPVAGYLMARRGVAIHALHCHSYPFTSHQAREKIHDLCRRLSYYMGEITVYSVNILGIQNQIKNQCDPKYATIINRRFMMRIAERIAADVGAGAIITGDNIAQVASQTMEGLGVVSAAVDTAIFRPLIAYDKLDIIQKAREIQTHDISIRPFEDACTVFLPLKVVTRPEIGDVLREEEALDIEALLLEALATLEEASFKQW